MINRERRWFELRTGRRPQLDPLLSGWAKVAAIDGHGYAKIRFSQRLVDHVGKVLPRGLTPDNPAFLYVFQLSASHWVVSAIYYDRSASVLLWETKQRPAWVPSSLHSTISG